MDRKYPLWKPASAALPREDGDVIVRQYQNLMRTRSGSDADTNSTSPIVAQRLSPDVMPVFVSEFPLYDVIEKVPSNGVSHTFLQQTNFTQTTDPNTISETGTVNDDQNSYLRMTTGISIFAQRRGVSLKAQYAGAAAGGPSSDLMGRELSGGLLTLARDGQKETLRYQAAASGSTTTTDPNGKYDPNGFNGLRYVLNNYTPPENSSIVDISTPGWTDHRVLVGLQTVADAVWDKGGKIDLIVCNTTARRALFSDMLAFLRYTRIEREEIIPGLSVGLVELNQGLVPVLVVPGDHIGQYITGGHTYTDLMCLWTETLEIPYLGAPEPSVLRIPIGTDGTLRELAIPFHMIGLATLAPQYLARVQLKTA